MTAATRPVASTPREYHFPEFERHTLPNGLTLVVASVRNLPIVTMMAVVDAGAVAEPAGQEGVAQLVARALNEGTPKYDGEALTEYLEQLGTSIGGVADWDYASLGMTVMRNNLENAFVHFVEALVVPTFPQAAIERLKSERIAELLQLETEPRELADEKFDEYIYNTTSRFRLPRGGSRQSVGILTRDEVVSFHAKRYRPGATTLVAVGDVDVNDVRRLVEAELGAWTGGGATASRADDRPVRLSRAVRIVQKDDAPQSEVRIGHVGVPRGHADYFAITVMNAVMGGLFSSRINLNLREAHGYTYGASSAFDWRREAGPFVIGTAVGSEVTVPAIQETLKEIGRMRSEEISESELSLATSYLEGVFPIRYDTTAAIAAALAALAIYDLPVDWYDSYRSRIASVTVADVLRVAQQQVHLESLQIVIVGNANVIREPLEALAFGPVDVVNP